MDTEEIARLCESLSISEVDGPICRVEEEIKWVGCSDVSHCLVGKVLSGKRVNREAFKARTEALEVSVTKFGLFAKGGSRVSQSSMNGVGDGLKNKEYSTELTAIGGVSVPSQMLMAGKKKEDSRTGLGSEVYGPLRRSIKAKEGRASLLVSSLRILKV
ncbi:hypothetical protein ACOSQ3_010726 [Xanthoceras sorbifolium]